MEKIIKEIKLARGILFQNEDVLLVQDIRPGQGHYFLPGGKVEPGESIKEAFLRKFKKSIV